jgi:hypothetical protein
MSEAKSTVIPDYLTASSPQGLRRLMLLNNKKRGAWHNYQIHFVDGKWFAWYHVEVMSTKEDIDKLMSNKAGDQ